MAADNAAAWPRDAEIPLTDVRSVPKTGLARPPPTQQTARKGRLNFLYVKDGGDMKEEYYEEYRRIGLKISYYRKLKGITQEQLAEQINKNTAFIGAVEAPNVNRTVSLDTLFDIAKALDIPAYKFLKDD
ncbi:helix-turn-helix domain-containing protein [Psychrobacter fulvigenes]|uniref:helix-turn-helix domain-containing protein n=1 Tax=Psychrobacter fulvigenes TaxID=533323 RepID=UPI001919A54D|nr:helix-turn-helix transcriptional regulator [Psychrobacter fulvigenes]